MIQLLANSDWSYHHRLSVFLLSPRLDVYECGEDFIDDSFALRIDLERCLVALPNDAI